MKPYFSLITSTVGRAIALERLLKSLQTQTYQAFELILVDQSQDNQIQSLARQYQFTFPLQYINAQNQQGVSMGRNLGLQQAKGNLIAIPDDDCWYSPLVLQTVTQWFEENPNYDGLCGRSVDLEGKLTSCRWDNRSGDMNKHNIWRRAIGSTIFLKARVIQEVGYFDTQLGSGTHTPWQCGEETDYLLRALAQGFKLYYSIDLEIYHLEPILAYPQALMKRAKGYGLGYGYMLRKHRYPIPFMVWQIIRPLGGTILSLAECKIDKAKYYWTIALRRLQGMLMSNENYPT